MRRLPFLHSILLTTHASPFIGLGSHALNADISFGRLKRTFSDCACFAFPGSVPPFAPRVRSNGSLRQGARLAARARVGPFPLPPPPMPSVASCFGIAIAFPSSASHAALRCFASCDRSDLDALRRAFRFRSPSFLSAREPSSSLHGVAVSAHDRGGARRRTPRAKWKLDRGLDPRSRTGSDRPIAIPPERRERERTRTLAADRMGRKEERGKGG